MHNDFGFLLDLLAFDLVYFLFSANFWRLRRCIPLN
jgi:hypothetical protein